MVFTVRRPSAPARGCILWQDGDEHVHEFDGSGLTIGRAADNDLVIPDSRVSRHHPHRRAPRDAWCMPISAAPTGRA